MAGYTVTKERSPIPVLTGLDVEQLRRCKRRRYQGQQAKAPPSRTARNNKFEIITYCLLADPRTVARSDGGRRAERWTQDISKQADDDVARVWSFEVAAESV